MVHRLYNCEQTEIQQNLSSPTYLTTNKKIPPHQLPKSKKIQSPPQILYKNTTIIASSRHQHTNMTQLSEHNLHINTNTLLICYNISYQVELRVVRSEQELQGVILENLGRREIRVIRGESGGKEEERGKDEGKGKEKEMEMEKGAVGEKLREESDADLLGELEDDNQVFALEKAYNILESMMKKTEKKIVQSSSEWLLKKVEQDFHKYQKARQHKTLKAPPPDKKQKKQLKKLQKKLQELSAKKQVLETNLLNGVQDKQKMQKLNITFPPKAQSDSSSLLCNFNQSPFPH